MRPLGAPILCRSLQRYLFVWKQVTVKLRHLFFFGIIAKCRIRHFSDNGSPFVSNQTKPHPRCSGLDHLPFAGAQTGWPRQNRTILPHRPPAVPGPALFELPSTLIGERVVLRYDPTLPPATAACSSTTAAATSARRAWSTPTPTLACAAPTCASIPPATMRRTPPAPPWHAPIRLTIRCLPPPPRWPPRGSRLRPQTDRSQEQSR